MSENRRRAREQIEANIEAQQIDRRIKLFKQRLDIVKASITMMQRREFQEAIRGFYQYLKLLEDYKGVGPGQLRPELFLADEDKREVLMLAGVYWDLVKIFDKTRSEARERDFRNHLEQFLRFTKGQTFQHSLAENLRKYIQSGAATHSSDLKRAYQELGGAKCFVATSLLEEITPATWDELQKWKASWLENKSWGARGVQLYYLVGPYLAFWCNQAPPPLRRWLGKRLDQWVDVGR
jgi:hypothetical protein